MADATSYSSRAGPPSAIPDTDYTDEFDPFTAGPERKKEGQDWWAVWSSKSKRVLDVNLVHTLVHDT
jgi:general transcriptional corepressor TUP1